MFFNLYSVLLRLFAAVFVWLTFSYSVFAVDSHVDRFFAACVGSLPDYTGFAETLPNHGYKLMSEKSWVGPAPDFPILSVQNKSGGRVCTLALTGDQSKAIEDAVTSRLATESQWRYEKKEYQGRFIYLVQTMQGRTILEVIPPVGASTFIVSHSLK